MLKAQQESIKALESTVRAQQKSITALESRAKTQIAEKPSIPTESAVAASAPTLPQKVNPDTRLEPAASPVVSAPKPKGPIDAKFVNAPAKPVFPKEPDAPEATEPSLPSMGVELFGFAQLDTIYDIDRMGTDWNATLRPSKIPVYCPPMALTRAAEPMVRLS